ncbi:MAG: signal recognition particle-docking protein FtsY [Lachnospiraceae bacterium]|nr:signal recognition particle-docking protein FtsY [Lachnospiraceae bacterium]
MAKIGFFGRLKHLFAASDITEDFFDELEETLILSDVGMEASEEIIAELRRRVSLRSLKFTDECKECLKDLIKERLEELYSDRYWETEPALLMIVGVNGVGKTTTIGKLAASLTSDGRRVMLVAADTFRAGAAEQLTVWAERSGADIIAQKEGADPSSVMYDGIAAAKSRRSDVILVDTAGRLHNKKNLMEELAKMNRVAEREAGSYRKATLIVLDATTGQNALSQARVFTEATDVAGIILTKVDGTAKGGVVLAIQQEIGVPIVYLGCGERVGDLEIFDADSFVDAMFEE